VKYKAKVLKYVPNAKAVVSVCWSDGTPRHITIEANGKAMDIHDINDVQGYTAAWQSAWFWLVRSLRSA
jgi:hypothetical protein